MSDSDLDMVYTELCRTLAAVGQDHAPLFLARVSLLSLQRLGDAGVAKALIAAAARDVLPTVPG